MALERSFGEIRLADFDTLELSNLNRIRSGVHEMGCSKVVNTAREIAEIDPWLKVTCYPQGITAENIDAFLTEGGKLDVLVEECDGVYIKILCRQRAKAFGIPVLMDTSDRSVIDVERFDLEPDRPILHGLVDHLDLDLAIKAKTNEEKLPFVIPIIGLDSMSTRMKASMLEIESTVTTWPQLSSSVFLGSALIAETHRRIALDQFQSSGRWYADGEAIISTDTKVKATDPLQAEVLALSEENMFTLAELLPADPTEHKAIPTEHVKALVEAGSLAPSAGNLQPWKFLVHDGKLLVFHDAHRGDSALDAARLIPSIDMGTCLENIRLKALALGLNVSIENYPLAEDQRLVAVVSVVPGTVPKRDALVEQLEARCTNRRKGDSRALPNELVDALNDAASGVDGCQAHIVSDRDALSAMAEVIAEAERIRVLNAIGHHELFHKEIRWSTIEAERTRDGLDLPTMELKLSEEVGFRVAADRAAMDLLSQWNAGRSFMKMTRENIASSSGLVVISTRDTTPSGWLEAGRAVQRVWLKATELACSVHPCAAPILLSHHVRFGNGSGFDTTEQAALLDLSQRLSRIFNLGTREPVFMMRLAYAPPPTARSLRLPLNALLLNHHTNTV
jgi:hypothetical protein